MIYKFDEFVNEKDTITVYHGTQPKFVDGIKRDGLVDNSGYNQGWYMVSTDFYSALFHAYSEKNENVYVVEFEIPVTDNSRWLGYPYLWKGEVRDEESTWFALMQKIPKEFVRKIHEIPYGEWLSQKQAGF